MLQDRPAHPAYPAGTSMSSRPRSLRLLLVLIISGAALTGCGDDRPPAAVRAAHTAQRGVAHPLFWVGETFAGLPLTHVSHNHDQTTLIYGTCTPAGDMGCAPPLEIQASSICDRNALILDIRPRARFSARDVGVLDYGDRLEVATGSANVAVLARDQGLARRAISALRPLGEPHRPSLAAPRYPRWYLGQLRRVHDAYHHTHSLRAVRDKLHISTSAVRFELALARELGAARLRRAGRDAPALPGCSLEPAGP